jgi:hypothetical protein
MQDQRARTIGFKNLTSRFMAGFCKKSQMVIGHPPTMASNGLITLKTRSAKGQQRSQLRRS